MFDEEAEVILQRQVAKVAPIGLKISALVCLENIMFLLSLLSCSVKMLFKKLYFLFLKIYNSRLFKNMLSNNYLCFSLMSQELIAVEMFNYLLYVLIYDTKM